MRKENECNLENVFLMNSKVNSISPFNLLKTTKGLISNIVKSKNMSNKNSVGSIPKADNNYTNINIIVNNNYINSKSKESCVRKVNKSCNQNWFNENQKKIFSKSPKKTINIKSSFNQSNKSSIVNNKEVSLKSPEMTNRKNNIKISFNEAANTQRSNVNVNVNSSNKNVEKNKNLSQKNENSLKNSQKNSKLDSLIRNSYSELAKQLQKVKPFTNREMIDKISHKQLYYSGVYNKILKRVNEDPHLLKSFDNKKVNESSIRSGNTSMKKKEYIDTSRLEQGDAVNEILITERRSIKMNSAFNSGINSYINSDVNSPRSPDQKFIKQKNSFVNHKRETSFNSTMNKVNSRLEKIEGPEDLHFMYVNISLQKKAFAIKMDNNINENIDNIEIDV